MRSSNFFFILLLTLILLTNYSLAQEPNIIENEGEIKINTKSKNVWKVLTNTKKYAKVMGYEWKSGKKNVETVGDQAEIEILEEPTSYQLTFIQPGERLTIKLSPINAKYINEKTWEVIPEGKWATRVRVKDVYTLPTNIAPPTVSEQINTLQKRLEKLKSTAELSF